MMSCGAKISVSEHQASGILDTKVSYQDTTLVIEYKFLRDKEKLSDKLQTAVTQIVTKEYGNIKDLINNIKSTDIAAIDEYTYDYYVRTDLKNYKDITVPFDMCFKSECFTPLELEENIIKKETLKLNYELDFDFDVIVKSIPKSIFNSKCLNKSMKELIINLGFLYELDPLTMADLIKTALNEKGCIEKETLRKNVRKYYQFNNNNRLPSLLFKSQPEYLKTPAGDNSMRGKIIQMFENINPVDFLRNKYQGVKPTNRDIKIIEMLIIDLEMPPAVVNVLLDF